jgi:filamentous hemagglutinin
MHPHIDGFRDVASQVGSQLARHEIGNFANDRLGISGLEFDAILTGASFAGNALVGDRIKAGMDSDGDRFTWISGILSRNITDRTPISNVLANRIIGLPFDAIDVTLGYQGLPTATGWEIILNGSLRAQIASSHSLGALDMKTQRLLGTIEGGKMFSLPFGNIAPDGINLEIGGNDPVSGFRMGQLFNWFAHVQPLKPEFLGLSHTDYTGAGFPTK